MNTEAWLRVKLLQAYPKTGEYDVEVNNAGEPLAVCVWSEDVIRCPILIRQRIVLGHSSDCALCNDPARPPKPCNCGAMALAEEEL